MSAVSHRISAADYFLRLLRSRLVRWLGKHRHAKNAARIACFPGDDIGDQIIAHGWYEDILLAALFEQFLVAQSTLFRDGVALDVGANIGNHTLWFARRFSRVVAFEPNPICTHLLGANLLMNRVSNVDVVSMGLSDSEAELTFHMDQELNLGRSGVTPSLATDTTRSFPVRVDRGDRLLETLDLAGSSIRLIKLDVEGHELSAMKGLIATIDAHKPLILFESHRADGDSGSNAIVDLLSSVGYRHYYVVESTTSPYRFRLLKLLHRAVHGLRIELRAVERPENRSYSLIVAATEPPCAC